MIKLYRQEIIELPRGAREAAALRHEIGQALIRQAAKELCAEDAPVLLRTENGKPYFKNLPLKFSLSHSEKRVILAVSDKEIGVDIQYMYPRRLDSAKRFFTAKEQEYINGDMIRFYEIWTKKEAYAKWDTRGVFKVLDVDVTGLVFYTENDGEYALAVYEK